MTTTQSDRDNIAVNQENNLQENVDNKNCVDERIANLGINFRSANDCAKNGALQPDPISLYDDLWYQGELCALYADTNLGKSILAVQIAEEVANKGFKVLYVDLELSDKGFEVRSRRNDGSLYEFSPNFYRCDIDFRKIMEDNNGIDDNGFDVLDRLETLAIIEHFDVVIIDNITALCSGVESGDIAVRLVNRLLQMRNSSEMSILFVAHTPKLDRTQPITRDSMAGSKRVISLIDSAFAIGQSLKDPALRYIKQTKVRMGECKYHENNVKVCRIKRVDGLLRFVGEGFSKESDLLTQYDRFANADDIIADRMAGMSHKSLCQKYKKSEAQIRYILNRRYKQNDPVVQKLTEQTSLDI